MHEKAAAVLAISDLLTGQYDQVQRIVAFNPVEGWSRAASEDIAGALEAHIAAEGREVSEGLRDFIEGQPGFTKLNTMVIG